MIYQFHGTIGPDMVSFSRDQMVKHVGLRADSGFPIYQKGERDKEFQTLWVYTDSSKFSMGTFF